MKLNVLLIILITLAACNPAQQIAYPSLDQSARPKNIIFLIGDGMGLSQITGAMYTAKKPLAFEQFPVIGLQKTECKDELITDSAASATAMARGIKADYNTFGTTENYRAPKSVLEEAEAMGKATGITVTSSLTHATPAAFITYQYYRSMYEEIAADYLDLEVDYLVGGGKKFFDRRTIDERNLVQEFQDKGFVVQSYLDDELYNIRIPDNQNFIYFTADSEPLAHMAGRTYFPIACLKGIEYLEKKSDKGFFFLIESSQIDWGGHANEDKIIIDEIIEFDEVIGNILDYAREDGETLVLVTADHETGGFAINGEKNRRELSIAFTTKSHTATMVPLFAYGPGSDLFRGVYDNTEIYRKLKALMQF